MAKFLDVEELVDLYLRELPENMFASDRADHPTDYTKRSISSSEIRAQMTLLATAYASARQIYDNKFVTLCDNATIPRYERDYFDTAQDAARSITQRRQAILDKIRAEYGISYRIISGILDGIFAQADIITEGPVTVNTPDWVLEESELDEDTYLVFRDPSVGTSDLTYTLVTWSCQKGGAWILEESALDESTYLADTDPLLGMQVGMELDCDLDYAAAGLTLEQLLGIQATAFTYEVRIMGDAEQVFLDYLAAQLIQIEPARSTGVIYNNFPGPLAP